MALSQLQCLDDNHVNLRTNESKPEFLYSEEQRLALETLLDGGRELFEEFLKSSSARSFLSELEVARFTGSVEAFCPDVPVRAGGDADEVHGSLQYWPDRSDTSVPELDMGWPDSGAYRGVTRAHVYAQPPLEGDAHIKEIVRKSIAQAQKVIAVVMDLFTDVDIFQDLLDASLKRKVAVYIILETTGVPHFLKMCERAAMHTGHLKNLRVRSIRGAEFFTRSSKKICGTQSQKFMFVDGDKALSGSYSFTWTASRLDRNIITMLTGQAVDAFDKLFRELYAISNGVNMSKIKLDNQPTPEPAPQSAPALLPSSTMALRLINPKYALVSSGATANSNNTPPAPEPRLAKNGSVKQMKELPEPAPVHPGLLHLEKANMIEYLPVWPEPDPPSDVIGFINIRDYNKPLQAHLMRSELFEVSQAIRFKDPFQVPEEPLFGRTSLQPKVVESSSCPLAGALTNEQPISMQPQTSLEENNGHARPLDSVELPLSSPNEQTSGFLSSSNQSNKDSALVHGLEKLIDSSLLQREEIHTYNTKQYEDPQIFMKPQLEPLRAESKLPLLEPKTMHTPKVHASNFSSASDEYFECSDSLTVDSGFEGMINGMLADSGLPEQHCHPDDSSNTVTQFRPFVPIQLQQLALAARSYKHESDRWSANEPKTDVTEDLTGHETGLEIQADGLSEEHESGRESLKKPDEPQQPSGLQTQCDAQPAAAMALHLEPDKTETGSETKADSLSEEHESDFASLKGPDKPQQPSRIQTQCDAQPAAGTAFHWEPDKTETGSETKADSLSEEHESGFASLKGPDEPQQPSRIQTQCDAQPAAGMAFHWEPDKTETGLEILADTLTKPHPKVDQQQMQDDSLILSHEIKPLAANLLEDNTDTQVLCEEKVECLDTKNEELPQQELGHVEHPVVNDTLGLKPVEGNKSQLAENEMLSKSVLQAKASSPDYFKCSDSCTVDSRFEGMVSVMLHDSGLSEQDWNPDDTSSTVKHTQSFVSLQLKPLALAASCYEHESGPESLKALDEPQHPSGLQKQSEATRKADQQQVQETQDDRSTLAPESKPFKANTNTQEASEEKAECLDRKSEELEPQELDHVEPPVVNDILGLKPVEANKSLLAENELLSKLVLQAKASSPVIVVQTKTESQSIVFSDRIKEVPHQLHSRFKDTSNPSPAIKVNDIKHARTQQKVATLRAVFESAEKVKQKNRNLPPLLTDLTVEVEGVRSFVPELKENAVEETMDSKDKPETNMHKTLAGPNIIKHNTDEHSSTNKQKVSLEVLGRVEPVGEHTSSYRNQPEAKPKLEGDVRKVHRPSSKHIRPQQEARAGPFKPSATKQHSSNHPTAPSRPAATTTGAQYYLHGKQLGQNRAVDALPTLPDKLLTRRSAPTRASQSPLRHSRLDPSPSRISASAKQPQAQQDKTKTIQLGQPSSRQRSASTIEDSPLSTAALFLRRMRSLTRESKRVPPKENRK